ncbi:TetR-like C-terminal domain-containing protein [Amycolatopsis sp. NPDC051045]|uniref:TetR-like C-terminal domain-containing protein n=1 Tax=Amycolatopsis sp. NPDC051045 TaxID=3156922 RepID=UPI0034480A9A
MAARAEVTPSTIYRRWGDLRELLSDVAVERLRPEAPPEDRGGLAADLGAWAEQFRATERGEPVPDVETVLDSVVAPMMYRILFRPGSLDPAYARRLVSDLLS